MSRVCSCYRFLRIKARKASLAWFRKHRGFYGNKHIWLASGAGGARRVVEAASAHSRKLSHYDERRPTHLQIADELIFSRGAAPDVCFSCRADRKTSSRFPSSYLYGEPSRSVINQLTGLRAPPTPYLIHFAVRNARLQSFNCARGNNLLFVITFSPSVYCTVVRLGGKTYWRKLIRQPSMLEVSALHITSGAWGFC